MRWSSLFSLYSLPILHLLTSAQTIGLSNTPESSVSTCPYRTINYITHSLAQQCLATSRSISHPPQEHTDSAETNVIESPVIASEEETKHSGNAITTTTLPSATNVDLIDANRADETPAGTVQKIEKQDRDIVKFTDTTEEDSALESGNFLSFEEWKKQNLKKVGQSEHIARRNQDDTQEPRKRPASVQNSLESLGDDGEIDLDFSGFVPGGPRNSAREVSQPIGDYPVESNEDDSSELLRVLKRSKDAGTTCKERFNYASFDCAANVLKTNKEAKSATAVLLENKDSYMLNQCSAQNKLLILELCNDISIDTVVLANFEFFSSTFRTFRVSVSDQYPVKAERWKTLGVYEARNTREVQAFLVENPLIWARYVRFEFLTHYGKEFYCPVSLVRVHGTTMMEDWKHLQNQATEDDNEEHDRSSHSDTTSVDSPTPEAVMDPYLAPLSQPIEDDTNRSIQETEVEHAMSALNGTVETQDANRAPPASVIAFEAIMSVIEPSDTCVPADSPSDTYSRSAPSPASSARILDASTRLDSSSKESSIPTSFARYHETGESITTSTDVTVESRSTPKDVYSDQSRGHSITHSPGTKSSKVSDLIETPSSSTRPSVSHKEKPLPPIEKVKTSSTAPQSQKDKPMSSASDRTKSIASATQGQPAVPTMQESFFKSVQKRLQMLEANSSLSLQYIEDQSRALRDAFKKVEQRQLTKTSAFLDQLNQTVLNELRDFRQQYDQLWQSTVIELEMQRERYERDNEAINTRLGILADEVIFQRRMAVLQMVLILVCLVLVLFSRGAINNYLELPLVQNVLARSPSSKWLKLSGVESSERPAPPARIRSAHQLRNGILKTHRRMQSEDSITDTQSGTELYAPPTPISDYGQSEVELAREDCNGPLFQSDKDDSRFEDPEFDPSAIERPSTSPPVLRVNGVAPVSDILETSEEEAVPSNLPVKSNSIPISDVALKVATAGIPIGKRLSWSLPKKGD